MNSGVGSIRIGILVDNEARPGLLAEHGFSALIEAAGRRILFDSGQGPALEHNAVALAAGLHDVDTLVLSHGHFDHSGGLPWVLERAPAAVVCCHPAALIPRYSISDGQARPVDMPDPARAALLGLPPGRVRWIDGPVQLAPGVDLSGPIPRRTEYEDTGGPFFIDPDGDYPDQIVDDQALWLRTGAGLIVVTGCSHSGLINTLRYAQRQSGVERIRAVIGGFHLVHASVARLERTTEALRELSPDSIVACHCTGEESRELLRRMIGESIAYGQAGSVLEFDGADTRR
ncbi:MAG: MBL fold metallo-hydrolase [Deltaproteobacteria bacterium]|nr:MBL fold metallo-hydrolase [Deltaproteobacteria bacterium]